MSFLTSFYLSFSNSILHVTWLLPGRGQGKQHDMISRSMILPEMCFCSLFIAGDSRLTCESQPRISYRPHADARAFPPNISKRTTTSNSTPQLCANVYNSISRQCTKFIAQQIYRAQGIISQHHTRSQNRTVTPVNTTTTTTTSPRLCHDQMTSQRCPHHAK